MNTCDIIIPTYNGAAKLKQHVIPALRAQAIPQGWEVQIIICDDGSEKPYKDNYEWHSPWHAPVTLTLPHGGRSKTRNAGIAVSSADVILLLADDIILRHNALYEHLLFHQQHSTITDGALGCIVWDPRIVPTPFMEWMMHGGQQNDYDAILGVRTCDPSQFFYGSFVSLKREFLQSNLFSEAFTSYGWEDLELGARLLVKGLTLTPLIGARALHRHKYSAQAILTRQYLVGVGATHVYLTTSRHIRHALYRLSGARFIVRTLIQKYGNRLNAPWIFQKVTAGEFWYGVYNQHVHRKG